jgi:signal transduction histidine kinase
MVNRCATDVLGPITVGRSIQSVNPQVARILEQTIRDRRAIGDFETIISHPNGERVPVVISSSCLTSSDNELTGAMVVVYDLSQVKRLEQNVQRAHRLSSIGTLAAGMAHEIKNPLVSIKTFTQLLLDRYNDPDFRTTFSDIVPHEVERIDSIVTRLLHFARPRPASFAPQNLRAIIEEVLTLVENQTRKECVAVEMEFSSAHVEVYGDEQQLHQVFLNLVLNAIDAMSESKTRTLRIKVEHGHMRLRRHGYDPLPEVECVKISVSDTGCGVHSDSLDRIFTPFYTTKHDGTGLGLSVVHGIVTEHQGDIYVESAPGEGTTFIITLPQIGLVAEMRGA